MAKRFPVEHLIGRIVGARLALFPRASLVNIALSRVPPLGFIAGSRRTEGDDFPFVPADDFSGHRGQNSCLWPGRIFQFSARDQPAVAALIEGVRTFWANR